ncbi:Asparagine synthase family protein [Thalictrum thalictroides]|uniref:Asparagine synthase family protein n=1 Tax=Thalictrum thalictroides TaxID=46969 RepID=A0A7J6WRC8_THATH|nr:Asparagine synthase family protein [Thalictrum thalictroides]
MRGSKTPIFKKRQGLICHVAQLLGLKEASCLPKRAIQFGSRIARESNRKNFGSNRAANQKSAGSSNRSPGWSKLVFLAGIGNALGPLLCLSTDTDVLRESS